MAVKVFISATTRGMRPYRELAASVVMAQGFEAVVQEHFAMPLDQMTREIQRKVFDCDGVLGIVGPFYGQESNVPGDGHLPLSYTQYELEYALVFRRPCFAMIFDGGHVDAGPPEPEEQSRSQAAFVRSLAERDDRRLGITHFSDELHFALALAKMQWGAWLRGR